MYRAPNCRAQRYATAATGNQRATFCLSLSLFSLPGPFNRVALFAAQITRESLDARGPGGLRAEEAPRPPLLILALGD